MIDITQWLRDSSQTLLSGEVIKPSHLSYLEAMNALEIMDPQMDSGAHYDPKGTFDPSAALTPSQIVWVMDEMTAREVAWYRGVTLSHSILTSLHYHNTLDIIANPDVDTYQDPATFALAEAACISLRAFVLAYAKAIELAYHTLAQSSGAARDAEDVWLDQLGIPLEATEGVEEVINYVDNVIDWLYSDPIRASDPWWAQVARRLKFRQSWVASIPSTGYWQGPDPALPFLVRDFVFSEETVDMAFDNVAPFLTQHMPLPHVVIPTHAEAWTELRASAVDIARLQLLRGTPLFDFEHALRGCKGMLPIIRAHYKAILLDSADRDALVGEWIKDASGLSPNTLSIIDASMTDQSDRRAFALWRDIVAGNLILTLAATLSNPSRQRRDYEHAAQTWADQAHAASRLTHYPSISSLATMLRVRAIDCELEATLLAFELDLFGKREHRSAWWWVFTITCFRETLTKRPTWETTWASIWRGISAAMQLLYTVRPLSGEKPSCSQFLLRHKLTIATVSPPCTPSFPVWENSCRALDVMSPTESLTTASLWLSRSDELLACLAPTPGMDAIIEKMRGDIAHNIAMIEMGRLPLVWEEGPRRIPRLV